MFRDKIVGCYIGHSLISKMSEPNVDHYQQVSPIGKPILDILGVEIQPGQCINTQRYLEEYSRRCVTVEWDYCSIAAIKYIWRLGQKGKDITSDLQKAIDYLTWADENIYSEGRIETAIDHCEYLLSKQPPQGIKITKLNELAQIPEYAHIGDSGADLRSTERVEIPVGKCALVPTGLQIDLPIGTEAQIRSRSGLAYAYCVTVLNSPGTIDSGYTGEIKVLLVNNGLVDFVVNPGDKIAQLVIAPVINNAVFELVDSIDVESERGVSGFGSTGI